MPMNASGTAADGTQIKVLVPDSEASGAAKGVAKATLKPQRGSKSVHVSQRKASVYTPISSLVERVPGEIFAAVMAYGGFVDFLSMLKVSRHIRKQIVWDCSNLAWTPEVERAVRGAGYAARNFHWLDADQRVNPPRRLRSSARRLVPAIRASRR